MMETDKIIEQLDAIYGKGKGMGIYTTIMPGIIADFTRMLKKSHAGVIMSEQYNLEDGKAVVNVLGTKTKSGQTDINIDVRKI